MKKLIESLLRRNPNERLSATQSLLHPYCLESVLDIQQQQRLEIETTKLIRVLRLHLNQLQPDQFDERLLIMQFLNIKSIN